MSDIQDDYIPRLTANFSGRPINISYGHFRLEKEPVSKNKAEGGVLPGGHGRTEEISAEKQ